MIHYLLHTADGSIRQRGQCQTVDDLPHVPGMTTEVIDAEDPRKPAVPVRNGYQNLRRMAYPNIGDQLDAIWDVLSNSGVLEGHPMAKAIYAQVKATKAKFPKT